MRLAVAEERVIQRILDDSYALWSDGMSRPAYARFNVAQMRTSWGARHLRRMVLLGDSGEILSSAKQYRFRARLDGQPITVVGIAAVFTPEPKRGRGHARTIVQRIVNQAAEGGADLALLFSEIDPGYYAAMGFTKVPRRESVLTLKGKTGVPAILVRGGEDRDIPAVTALAQAMARPYRFSIEQTDDLFRFSLAKKRLLAGFLEPGLLSVEFFIVEEGASAAAFVLLTVTRDDVILESCGDRDPTGARVGALLQVLRARTPVEPVPILTSCLPPGWLPPQVEIASTRRVHDVMMVRPLKEGILEKPLTENDVLFWHADMF